MHFKNNGVGNCVILKESDDMYALIYAYNCQEYIITFGLNKESGSWDNGTYFGKDLDNALNNYNRLIQEREMER